MSGYRSPFASWQRTAGVRTFAWDEAAFAADGQWVPHGYFAEADHPAVAPEALRGPVGAALLLGHLHFTRRLESELIAPVCGRLACRAEGEPEEIARDAIMIQCDESFHALLCAELARRVVDAQPLAALRFGEPRFLAHVRQVRAALAGRVAAARVDFAAAVVAETIVTRTLAEDWRDPAVRPNVRAFLKIHHRDEARHSAYFSQALALAWPAWPEEERAAIAAAWDGLVEAFARPDLAMIGAALRAGGTAQADVDAVVGLLDARSAAIGALTDAHLTRRALELAEARAAVELAA